jgi:serine/threonine protein kinase
LDFDPTQHHAGHAHVPIGLYLGAVIGMMGSVPYISARLFHKNEAFIEWWFAVASFLTAIALALVFKNLERPPRVSTDKITLAIQFFIFWMGNLLDLGLDPLGDWKDGWIGPITCLIPILESAVQGTIILRYVYCAAQLSVLLKSQWVHGIWPAVAFFNLVLLIRNIAVSPTYTEGEDFVVPQLFNACNIAFRAYGVIHFCAFAFPSRVWHIKTKNKEGIELEGVVMRQHPYGGAEIDVDTYTIPPQHITLHRNPADTSPPFAIGDGGFGSVFGVYYLNNFVAVKRFKHQNVKKVRSWHRELSVQRLHHPNVAAVYGSVSRQWYPEAAGDSDDVCPDLVMEYISDWSLEGAMNPRRCPDGSMIRTLTQLDQFWAIIEDVASGLSYIHSRHVCHNDLSGRNVLLRLRQRRHGPGSSALQRATSYYHDPSQVAPVPTAAIVIDGKGNNGEDKQNSPPTAPASDGMPGIGLGLTIPTATNLGTNNNGTNGVVNFGLRDNNEIKVGDDGHQMPPTGAGVHVHVAPAIPAGAAAAANLVGDDVSIKYSAVLIDFGLAHAAGRNIRNTRAPVQGPEETPSREADVYAFGVLLWEFAFSHDQPSKSIDSHTERLQHINRLPASDNAFKLLMARCCATKPIDRPTTSQYDPAVASPQRGSRLTLKECIRQAKEASLTNRRLPLLPPFPASNDMYYKKIAPTAPLVDLYALEQTIRHDDATNRVTGTFLHILPALLLLFEDVH